MGLAALDLGPIQLKNIAEPVRVYSLDVGAPAQAKAATVAKASDSKQRSMLAPLLAGIVALILVAGGIWYFLAGSRTAPVLEEADGDLMGEGINIAARLERVADPGAICLSEQAYWQVKGRLDLAVTDLGHQQLKNIADPIRVYSLDVGQSAPSRAKLAPVLDSEKSTPPRLSMVVLPFANIGGDPEGCGANVGGRAN
jgi:hypothetical protein